MRKLFRLFSILCLVTLVVAAFTGCQGYTLRAIISSPIALNLDTGAAQQLTITAGYDKGASINVTPNCTFKSSDDKVASVTSSGLVRGVSAGKTTVVATYTESRVTKTVSVPVTVQ